MFNFGTIALLLNKPCGQIIEKIGLPVSDSAKGFRMSMIFKMVCNNRRQRRTTRGGYLFLIFIF